VCASSYPNVMYECEVSKMLKCYSS